MLLSRYHAKLGKSDQLEIWFKDAPAMGATVGYYGTIVRILHSSMLRSPSRPDFWLYRVFIPDLDRHFDLPLSELCLTADSDPPKPPSCPTCEVQFDFKPGSDNQELHGAYRILPG